MIRKPISERIDNTTNKPDSSRFGQLGKAFGDRKIAMYPKDASQIKPVKPTGNAHVRWMVQRDIPEVLKIMAPVLGTDEKAAYKQLVSQLRERDVIPMVAEEGNSDQVLGCMLYRLGKTDLHIITMRAKPGFAKSAGEAMFAKLFSKLDENRRTSLTIYADETSDIKALSALKSIGFQGKQEGDQILFTYHRHNPEQLDDEEAFNKDVEERKKKSVKPPAPPAEQNEEGMIDFELDESQQRLMASLIPEDVNETWQLDHGTING